MPTITISGFDKGGINTDLPEWDLQPNQLTYGENFRCENGVIKSYGGHEDWSDHPTSTDLGELMYIQTESASYWLHMGTGTAATTNVIQVYDGSSWADITEAVSGYTVTNYNWSYCMLGGIPVINHPESYPQYWSPVSTSQDIQDLDFDATDTWRTKNYKANIIRSHRNFLIALGMTEGANEYPSLVRWSDAADAGGLPASWDETVTTNLAGTKYLAGEGGAITDAVSLRNGLAIYQEQAIWQMEYIGGTYVWSFRELSTTAGAIAHGCVAQVLNGHVVLSDGDILFNDGTTPRSIIHKRLKERLTSTIDADNYKNSFVTVHRQQKEVYFCVPTEGNTYPNIAYIWNYQDDTWSIRDLPSCTGMAYGSRTSGVIGWDDMTNDWTADSGAWGARSYTPLNDVLVATLPNATTPKTVVIDPIQTNDDTAFQTVLERTNFPIEGHGTVTTVTRIIPHMSGTKAVDMYIGSHDYAGSPVRWKGPVSFNPETDRKIDVRSTGELHAFKLVGTSDPNFELSGLEIEYVVSGTR